MRRLVPIIGLDVLTKGRVGFSALGDKPSPAVSTVDSFTIEDGSWLLFEDSTHVLVESSV